MSSLGPQSPIDMKPDTATLMAGFSPGSVGGGNSPTSPRFYLHSLMILNHQQRSSDDDRSGLGFSLPQPSFTIGHSGYLNNSNGSKSGHYPPNHPLSNSKHLCSICGDRASGKHYGVYSCEGATTSLTLFLHDSSLDTFRFIIHRLQGIFQENSQERLDLCMP
jgi:nuclear receptor subfamily 2 group B protein 4